MTFPSICIAQLTVLSMTKHFKLTSVNKTTSVNEDKNQLSVKVK